MNQIKDWDGACQRCFKLSDFHIMSMFDVSLICRSCMDSEKSHPDYPKAQFAEIESVKKGMMNFEGIGCPKDLEMIGHTDEDDLEELYRVYGGD